MEVQSLLPCVLHRLWTLPIDLLLQLHLPELVVELIFAVNAILGRTDHHVHLLTYVHHQPVQAVAVHSACFA